MINALIFLSIGLLLLFLEFYLPGAILGTVGAVLIVSSIFLYAFQAKSPLYVFIFVVVAALLSLLVVRFALWLIRKTRKSETIFQDRAQVGFVASTFPKEAIGKTVVALTDLKPGGFVLFEGKKVPAISLSGYIEKGKEAVVISGTGDALNVSLKKE